MRLTTKSKPARRNSARLTRHIIRSEDDAEQALKEIAAAQARLTDGRSDSAKVPRAKRRKGLP